MVKIKKYTFSEIAEAIGGSLMGVDGIITAISIDSREKIQGSGCFFAIKGKNFNGNDYIDEAISNGNVLVITEDPTPCVVSKIIVKDTVKALGLLAKHHKGKTKIVGVTGSVGKTTVKNMITLVLKSKYSVCSTHNNNNNEIGVALTLLNIKDEDFCIVEMGMRGLGEIKWLSYISEPCCSVITNVGISHLEYLKTEDNIFKAKSEIIDYTKKVAIVPYDEKFYQINYKNVQPVFFGPNSYNKIIALSVTENGINFRIQTKNNITEKITIQTRSYANATNALIAFLVGKAFDVEEEKIIYALKEYKDSGMRAELLNICGMEIILDCYNSVPDSAKNAIDILYRIGKEKNKNTVAVLGDMLELGDVSCSEHCKIGAFARERGISLMIAYGKFSKAYLEGFKGGIEMTDLVSIAKYIKSSIEKNSVVLLKASRAMQFEKILETLKE